ncbi:MAG: hypothetical protein Q9183_005955, partial [Haloplaca sp. 2 TL-2023]
MDSQQEDEAPELVDVGDDNDAALSNQAGDLAPAMEELKVSKVPLTIVTGIVDDPISFTCPPTLKSPSPYPKKASKSKNGSSSPMAASAAPSSRSHMLSARSLETYPFCRDQGFAAIEGLVTRRGAFDYIMLETTGLADPGNLAPLFWADEGLGSSVYLDGIVTLVDAKNILLSLDEPATSETVTDDDEEAK